MNGLASLSKRLSQLMHGFAYVAAVAQRTPVRLSVLRPEVDDLLVEVDDLRLGVELYQELLVRSRVLAGLPVAPGGAAFWSRALLNDMSCRLTWLRNALNADDVCATVGDWCGQLPERQQWAEHAICELQTAETITEPTPATTDKVDAVTRQNNAKAVGAVSEHLAEVLTGASSFPAAQLVSLAMMARLKADARCYEWSAETWATEYQKSKKTIIATDAWKHVMDWRRSAGKQRQGQTIRDSDGTMRDVWRE